MENMNDFNFPEEEIVSDNHFKIKYDLAKNCYKIKNIQGPGTFIKVLKNMVYQLTELRCSKLIQYSPLEIHISLCQYLLM